MPYRTYKSVPAGPSSINRFISRPSAPALRDIKNQEQENILNGIPTTRPDRNTTVSGIRTAPAEFGGGVTAAPTPTTSVSTSTSAKGIETTVEEDVALAAAAYVTEAEDPTRSVLGMISTGVKAAAAVVNPVSALHSLAAYGAAKGTTRGLSGSLFSGSLAQAAKATPAYEEDVDPAIVGAARAAAQQVGAFARGKEVQAEFQLQMAKQAKQEAVITERHAVEVARREAAAALRFTDVSVGDADISGGENTDDWGTAEDGQSLSDDPLGEAGFGEGVGDTSDSPSDAGDPDSGDPGGPSGTI